MRTPMLTRRGGDMGGKSIISNSYLEDIADAIRYKKGTEETFYPSQMGDAIRSIEGIVPTGTMEIDANGVYDVTEKAEVDVNVNPDLRPLSVSENGTYEPDGFDGYDSVTVDVLSIMDSLLEIVSSVTPEQNAYSLEFPCDKKTGTYIIVSDPPGTREFASQQRLAQTLNMVQFDIRGVPGALQSYDARSICYNKNPTSSNETDWWAAKINLGENSITVNPTSGRYPFLAGVTYYLLRVKGA